MPDAALGVLDTIRRLAKRAAIFASQGEKDLNRSGLAAAMAGDRRSGPDRVCFNRASYKAETRREPLASLIQHLKSVLAGEFGYDFARRTPGAAYYRPGGFIGWHTDGERPGRRVYCTWAASAGSCLFRAFDSDADRIETLYDPEGWSLRSFVVPNPPEQLWHCVDAGAERFAIGLRCRTHG